MIGGQWVEHPGGKIDYTVNVLETNDPISDGIKDFEIKNTEQYYMHIDPNTKVLATTKFTDSIHSWIKDPIPSHFRKPSKRGSGGASIGAGWWKSKARC